MGMISRMIKFAAISIIVLFIITTMISFLFPSKVIVSRAVNINAKPDSIIVLIKDMNAWKQWIEGMDDPSVHIFSSTESEMGATKVVIDSISNNTVRALWQNKKGKWMVSTIHLYTDSAKPVTVVQWAFEQNVKWYPWEKFGSFMNDKILGPMMEKNLDHLRKLAEKN
jgi:hypothetical protein